MHHQNILIKFNKINKTKWKELYYIINKMIRKMIYIMQSIDVCRYFFWCIRML